MFTSIATPVQTISTAFVGLGTSIASRVAARASAYFPQLDRNSLKIQLVRESHRPYSAFYEFQLSDRARRYGVIIKIPSLPSPGDGSVAERVEPCRPSLFGAVDSHRMAEFEFTSLVAIERHIEKIGDPRLGAIRPLELWRNPNSVVMEQNCGTSLRRFHAAVRRFRIGPAGIPFSPDEAIQNAGIWLREYHRLAPLPQTSDRIATRHDFLDALAAQIGYLIDQGAKRTFLCSVRAEMERHALRALPAQLELATSHGDYAPRNLLIGPRNRVTVLDTLARWRAPIYEDVASFLLALRAPAAQIVSFGMAYERTLLQDLEAQFLKQYFDDEQIPLVPIRLFEGLLLLDRWGAFVERAKRATGNRRVYACWRLATLRHFLFQYCRDTFRELDQLG